MFIESNKSGITINWKVKYFDLNLISHFDSLIIDKCEAARPVTAMTLLSISGNLKYFRIGPFIVTALLWSLNVPSAMAGLHQPTN